MENRAVRRENYINGNMTNQMSLIAVTKSRWISLKEMQFYQLQGGRQKSCCV